MEWLLSNCDMISWSLKMSNINGFELLLDLQNYLYQNNLSITSATFSSGFMLVLHEACRSGHIQFVQFVLDHYEDQFDINQLILYHPNFDYDISLKTIRWLCNHRKETLVHAAVHSQSVELLQLLVSHKASMSTPDCCSQTPLLKAVTRCDKDTVSYLLKAGCNVNYQDSTGRTVLMHICSAHVLPNTIETILSLLLEAGADPNISDQRGYTAIHEAVYNKNCTVLKLFIRNFKISPFTCLQSSITHPLFLANQLADLYSSKPTCFFPTQVITDHPNCPSQLKVDHILLNATHSLYRYCCDYNLHPDQDLFDCVDQFKHALRLRVTLDVPSSALPYKCYGNLTEVASLDELQKLYTANIKSNLVNFTYQCLIVRERILGYGDSTLIEFLLKFGKAFSQTTMKSHLQQGLQLWLRATDMILYRLKENIYSNLKELQKVTESGLEKCSNLVQSNKESQSRVECDLSQAMLWPILQNLIQCEYMTIQQFKAKHYHDIISPAGYRHLIKILQNLYQANVHGTEVSSLIYEALLKCSTFSYGFELSTNLVDVLLDEPEVSTPFLQLLLKYGGQKVINEIGLFGVRPLYKAKTQEVTNMLLKYGAHPDAVNEDGLYGNPHFMDGYFRSPLPLQCHVARAVVSQAIPYRSSELPQSIIDFISLHDPDHTQVKIKEGLRTLN